MTNAPQRFDRSPSPLADKQKGRAFHYVVTLCIATMLLLAVVSVAGPLALLAIAR